MVNNSSNINTPKESLNSDGQQFLQYQQNKRKFEQWWSIILQISTKQKKVLTVMVNNSTNINKTKERFNIDGHKFLQYQQTKRKFEQWWSTILPISTKQKKVLTVMVNNSTNINKTKESFNSDGQQFLQYQHTKRKFDQWWSTLPPISTKQKKVFTVMVNNSTNINKTKQSFNIDGQQFYQYQQNKRKI
jgi:GTP-sensing pleiotropic transcriptional regulator CodY